MSKVLAGLSPEWCNLLNVPPLDDIVKTVSKCKSLTPSIDKIFEFARLTDFSKIKVVILGQDPYPKAGDAHGLAFSCLTNVPGSLRNIYKCLLHNKLINQLPDSGNLEYWAKQGVLLINTALTTEIGKPNAHAGLWSDYIIDLLKRLSAVRPMIFMLWGNNARSLKEYINIKSTVYEWTHPSPLAVTKNPFNPCPHFTDANKLLMSLGHEPIDWNVDPEPSIVESALNAGPKTQVVFTDGSCYPNRSCPEATAGYAVSFALGTFKDTVIYGSIDKSKVHATNQRAEGLAIIKTMEFLLKHIDSWEELIIISDSEFWIKMIEVYMPAWAKSDKFAEKKNSDLTVRMWSLYIELTEEHSKSVQLRHMKSHDKDGWSKFDVNSYEYFCYVNNEYVDELAAFARLNVTPGKDVQTTATYDE